MRRPHHKCSALSSGTQRLRSSVLVVTTLLMLANGPWRGPDLQDARQEIAGAAIGGAFFVVGGFARDGSTHASAEAWTPGERAWRSLPDLPIAVHHPAAAAHGGRLYVFGGYEADGALRGAIDAVQVYDPEANVWSLATPMPRARGGLAAVVVGDVILVVGGTIDTPDGGQGDAVGDLTAYDPVHDTWTTLTPMPTPRDHLAVAAWNGRLHALGGRRGRDFTLDTHEVYDPTTGVWTNAPPLPTGRSGHAAFATRDGCLVALGGEGNPARRDGLFADVEAFDAAAGTWRRWPLMRSPRHGMIAFADADVAWVIGGATIAGFAAVPLTDAFALPPCRAAR